MILFCAFPLKAQYKDDVYASLYDGETVSCLKEHVGYLASAQLEGRKACSEGEKDAAKYIYEQLSLAGLDMLCGPDGDEFGIMSGADTLVSRNVIGFIQGYDEKLRDRYIVVGARLDNIGSWTMTVDSQPVQTIAYGANGDASGLAMMIELAKKAVTNRILLKRSVIFVAFGASLETYAGSWYFLNRSFAKDAGNIDLMINLDMLGAKGNDFYAFTSSNKDVNDYISNISSELQPIKPQVTATEPYPSDHRAFYAAEIPSVMFTTGHFAEYNTSRDTPSSLDYDQMEMELEYIGNFLIDLCESGRKFNFTPQQIIEPEHSDDVYAYYDCTVKPMFLNTTEISSFMKNWVYQYLKYPKEAVAAGIHGTVQVNFIIEKDGSVSSVTVVKGVNELLDNEAVRVIAASPKWRAARFRGQKVRSSITVPVEFKLEKKSAKKKLGINDNI